MGEPRIVYGHMLGAGSDCTVRPAVRGVPPGAVSAGSYAGVREELLEWLGRPEVARWVLRALAAELLQRPRNGLSYPAFASPVLRCLQVVAGVSDVAPPPVTVGVMSEAVSQGWLPVSRAAAGCGRSVAHVRRLVSSGAVRGERRGERMWLVDPVSLRSVLAKADRRASGDAA